MNNEEEKDQWEKAFQRKLTENPISKEGDEKIWANVLTAIDKKPKKSNFNIVWYAMAASVLLVLGFGLTFYKNNSNTELKYESKKVENNPLPKEAKSSVTPITETLVSKNTSSSKNKTLERSFSFSEKLKLVSQNSVSIQHLTDGSKVTLNKQSQLYLDVNFETTRNAKLTGEAYFEIAADKSRPFTIYFGESHLVVVGTKFNIRSLPEERVYEITVTEGIVKVFTEKGKFGHVVRKGEQIVINGTSKPLFTGQDINHYIRWTNDDYGFENTKLKDVAVALSRKFGLPINIDSSIRNCRFTGDLSGLSKEETLSILKLSNKLTIRQEKVEIYISGNSCD